MTKHLFYDKIFFMKYFYSFISKTKYFLLAFFLFSSVFFANFLFNNKIANANTQAEINTYLPFSSVERLELNSPLDIYHDQDVSAILSGDVSHQSLTVYKDGSFTEITQGSFTALKKIDRLNDSLVLVDNAVLKTLDLNDLSSNIEELKIGGNTIGCTTFDISGNYLATIFGNNIFVYEWDGQTFNQIATSANASADTVLACNSSGVFYLSGGAISYSSYNNFSNVTTVANVTPSHLIANDECVYFVSNNEIYEILINEDTPTLLSKPTTEFELGDIQNVNGLAFKNQNLLITDSSRNTIQEFNVDNASLIFTGFAIAKNKTAYNRISASNTLLDYSNGHVGVLDEDKLTIIKDDATDYSTANFVNVLFNGNTITDFALGLDTAILVRNKDVCLLDLNTTKETNVLFTVSTYCDYFDVCYRNGNYYVLSHNKNALGETFVTVICEQTKSVTNEFSYKGYVFTDIEVDLYGNYYFLDDAKLYTISDGAPFILLDFATEGISKPSQITTDFAGRLYALISNKLYYFNQNTMQFNAVNLSANINAFALSFDKKTVFFTNGTDENIYATTSVNNSSLNALKFNVDYVLSAGNADVNNLKKYELKQGATVFGYSVKDNAPTFTSLLDTEDEYLLICKVKDDFSDEYFLTLIGENNTVLVREKDAEVLALNNVEPIHAKVYVTTPVHAYYFPKITLTEDYVATDNQNKIKLSLNAEILPITEVDFNGTVFYFATILDSDTLRTLYVPKSFTSHTIESVSNMQTFTLEIIKQTTVYLDEQLTISLLTTEKNTEVRLFKIENGVAFIEIYNGENWVKAYVNASDILDAPNTAIRNVLIVLAVIACACGSITYYILRKRRNA